MKCRVGKITSPFTTGAEDDASSPMTQKILGVKTRLSEHRQTMVNTLKNLDLRDYRQSPDARGCLTEALEQLTSSVRNINDLLEPEQCGRVIRGLTDGDGEMQSEDTAFSVESYAEDSEGLSLPWATQVDERVSRAFQDLHTYLSGTLVALDEGDYRAATWAARFAEHTLPRVTVACNMLVFVPDANTSTRLRHAVSHYPRYVQAVTDPMTLSTPHPTVPMPSLGSDVYKDPSSSVPNTAHIVGDHRPANS